MAGEAVGTVEVSDYVFAEPMNGPLLHQAVVAQRANRRQGTHSVRTRGQVVHSGRKLRPQKGSGRARLGDAGNPGLRGGGVAHGPHPRSHSKRLPIRMRRRALRIALSDKVRNGYITVIEELAVSEPSTRVIIDMVSALNATGTTLIITTEPTSELRRSVRNIPGVDTLASRLLSPLETTRVRNILISKHAVERIDEIWGHPTEKPGRAAHGAPEPSQESSRKAGAPA
ncbi:MAG: 50S ribosomal protein L4 [Chloroflexi bacterium]|nr:50S ribosomal protein L4 [Chloroflexota bacterium]